MTLYEEYYIVGTFDLIGAIGGTLGMFVEFSFIAAFMFLLDLFKSLIMRL